VFPYRPPPVLVPRPLRLTVNERVDKEGNVRSRSTKRRCLPPPSASVTPEWGDRGLLPLVVPIAQARAPRRRHPARGTPGCLCQRLVRGAAPNPEAQPRGPYSEIVWWKRAGPRTA